MNSKPSRRTMLKAAAAALAIPGAHGAAAEAMPTLAPTRQRFEGKDTAKICLEAGLIYPEHPRGIDYDRERPNFRSQYPGGGGYAGFAFNVGYTRAMMQAALAR